MVLGLRVRQGTSLAVSIRHRDRAEQIWRTVPALQHHPKSVSATGRHGGCLGKNTVYSPSACTIVYFGMAWCTDFMLLLKLKSITVCLIFTLCTAID